MLPGNIEGALRGREEDLEDTISWFNRVGERYRRRGWRLGRIEEYISGDTADLGSGHGSTSTRLLRKNAVRRLILVDLAEKPLSRGLYAAGPLAVGVVADIRDQVIRDGVLDTVLLLASLHNIPGRQNRLRVLKNACRTLRPGGRLLVLVWSLLQPVFIPVIAKSLFKRLLGRGEMGDTVIEDGVGRRFYHLYRPGELRRDLVVAGCRVIEYGSIRVNRSLFKPGRNHYAVAERPPGY